MKYLLLVLCFISTATYAHSTDSAAIRQMLAAQVTAWNAGSVEGYMHGYWESDSLVFIGKNGPTYGYAATLKRYKAAYPDQAHMGQLTSDVISMRQLSPEYYFVIGKWSLKRSAGDVSGSWTLLLHKVLGKWVIIVDHSS